MKKQFCLYLKEGYENRATVDSIYRENSFFHHSYEKARDMLEEILNNTIFYQNEVSPTSSAGDRYTSLMAYPSNVIAFVSHRGQGKSSAMVSFSTALKKKLDPYANKQEEDYLLFWGKAQKGKNTLFEVVDCIDPTTMEKDHSILQLILWRMFHRLEQKYTAEKQYVTSEVKEQQDNLVKQFQRCFTQIKYQQPNASHNVDKLQEISQFGESVYLAGSISHLVQSYLNFMHPNKESCLVVQIDDADLNISQAYEIIEDLRKYFTIPQVAILMAMDIQQMQTVVEQQFLKEFSVSLATKSMVSVESCHLLAMQNVQKLIPTNRQIYLPSVGDVLKVGGEPLRLIYMKQQKDGSFIYDDTKKNNILYTTRNDHYDKQLISFLNQKTGLYFHHTTDKLHPFLPVTMRNLTHFLGYFKEFKNIHKPYENYFYYLNSNINKREQDQPYNKSRNYFKLSSTVIEDFWKTGAGLLKDTEQKIPDSTACTTRNLANLNEIEQWGENLNSTLIYLMGNWASVNLNEENRVFLQKLQKIPLENKHTLVLEYIPFYYSKLFSKETGGWKELEKSFYDDFIQKSKNRQLLNGDKKGSYSNVQGMLDLLCELKGDVSPFVYSIRLYYSILLHTLFLDCYTKEVKEPKVISFLNGDLFSSYTLQTVTGCKDLFATFSFQPQLFFSMIDPFIEVTSENCNRLSEQQGLSVKHDRKKTEQIISPDILSLLSLYVRGFSFDQQDGHSSRMTQDVNHWWKVDCYFGIFFPILYQFEEINKNKQIQFNELYLYAMTLVLNYDKQYEVLQYLEHKYSEKEDTLMEISTPEWYRTIAVIENTELREMLSTTGELEFSRIFSALVLSSQEKREIYQIYFQKNIKRERYLIHRSDQLDRLKQTVWPSRTHFFKEILVPYFTTLLENTKQKDFKNSYEKLKKIQFFEGDKNQYDEDFSLTNSENLLRNYLSFMETALNILNRYQKEILP